MGFSGTRGLHRPAACFVGLLKGPLTPSVSFIGTCVSTKQLAVTRALWRCGQTGIRTPACRAAGAVTTMINWWPTRSELAVPCTGALSHTKLSRRLRYGLESSTLDLNTGALRLSYNGGPTSACWQACL